MGKCRWGTSSPNIGGEKKRGYVGGKRGGGIRFRIRLGVRGRGRVGLGFTYQAIYSSPIQSISHSSPRVRVRAKLGLALALDQT